jgi:hypothetical protein
MMYRNMFGAGPKAEDEKGEEASGVKIIVEELKK